ncbi:MAG: hypothetical protein R2766_08540 [Saprospiraceae bacterium]
MSIPPPACTAAQTNGISIGTGGTVNLSDLISSNVLPSTQLVDR